jgi:hypothetical protein
VRENTRYFKKTVQSGKKGKVVGGIFISKRQGNVADREQHVQVEAVHKGFVLQNMNP